MTNHMINLESLNGPENTEERDSHLPLNAVANYQSTGRHLPELQSQAYPN